MVRSAKTSKKKQVEAFRHDGDTRKNIPPAEYQSMLRDDEKTPIQVAYEQRNPDLDPQLVWRHLQGLERFPYPLEVDPQRLVEVGQHFRSPLLASE